MKILNPRNLPESIINALTPDYERNPDPKRFGVRELIDPPMIRHLRGQHENEIEVIAEDYADILIGQAIHNYMEKFAPANHVTEEKIEVPFKGFTIVGKPDCYYDIILDDYKYTSVWSYIYGAKKEWEVQLNIYRWLIYKKHGQMILNPRNIAFFKDWKARDAEFNSDYPPAKIMIIPTQIWDFEKVEEYIDGRLWAHQELIPCTNDEKYHAPDTFAVMKKGRKTAMRVLSSEEEAKGWMASSGGDYI